MDHLKLRRATDDDAEFAYRTKEAGFRRYVEQVWGWNDEEQRRLHARRYNSQEFSVIQLAGVDVGIIAVVREPDCFRLNQLFVLPEYQGKGIGTTCTMRVVEDASAAGLPVQLRVLKANRRAAAFFQSLGFRRVGESDTHFMMQRPVCS
jgi:ribosomal protein S18 acetylase RimI-like enzyme